jgi:UDP-N-acetylmuramate dehydrogenase
LANEVIDIHTINDLHTLFLQQKINTQSRVLGGGSNILFTKDFEGQLLRNLIKGTTVISESSTSVEVSFGGGEIWHDAVTYCVNNGWGGLENLSLIPGTVGASPIQNIGAYGSEIKDTFKWLKAFNLKSGEVETFDHSMCEFGYRDSFFKRAGKNTYFITEVCFELLKNPQVNIQYGDIQKVLSDSNIMDPTIKDVSNAIIHIRQSKLPNPKLLGNCGSFFKNPVISKDLFQNLKNQFPDIKSFPISETQVKVPAGWLIETSGWKGKKIGHVGVHEKQALVLVHFGGGNGIEIKQLADKICTDIYKKFQIQLEIEVNIW